MRGQCYANYRIPFEYKDSSLVYLDWLELRANRLIIMYFIASQIGLAIGVLYHPLKLCQVLPEIDSESPLLLSTI